MMDTKRLQSELDAAISRFVSRAMALAQELPSHRVVPDDSRDKVLGVVTKHPEGATAGDIADSTGLGLAPTFEVLRDLVAQGVIRRVVVNDAELPLYCPR